MSQMRFVSVAASITKKFELKTGIGAFVV